MALVLDSTVFSKSSGVVELDTLLPQGSFEVRRNRILLELTGGELKRFWLSFQIVVGETVARKDTAYVQVSFVDGQTHKQHLTRFGLVKRGRSWFIFSFKKTWPVT